MVLRHLERGASLPVLPAAAADLMVLMGREDTSAKQLSDVIHRDQALAAHVLRVANTPAYRGVTAIVSLQQAVARLGMRLLSEIALSVTVQGAVFNVGRHRGIAADLWRRAYATALVAKEIARAQRNNVEAAFLCGLLHDFGAPIVLRATVLAAEAIDEKVSADKLTALMFELSPEVGGRVAERWEMPARVCTAIRHHRDFSGITEHRYDAALTGLARAIADWMLQDDDDPAAVRVHPAVAELNLYADEVDALLAKRDAVLQALSAVTT